MGVSGPSLLIESTDSMISQSAIRRAFAWKKGNEIHTAVTRRRDREYH